MAEISRRNFVVLTGATMGALASGAMLGACSSGGTASQASSSDATVDGGLANMTWDQILEEAKGQTVTFLAWGSGGADAFVQQWWTSLQSFVKDEYDIDLQYTEFSQAEYQKISTDIENGGDPTYDMFWYTGAMIAPFRQADGVFQENWIEKLPNYQYLDTGNKYVTFDGADYVNGMEAPFQGVSPSLVYSSDTWDSSLAWDASEGGKNGLFHNFNELYQWAQKYPGQFSYMDLTGNGSFHGLFFLKAVLAELTDNGSGGWQPVYDEADDAQTRRKKIQENIQSWYDWSSSSEASEEAFYTKASYLWAYLNDLKPYLMQGDSGPVYMATAPDMMNYVKAGSLACTFTTCTSISARVAASPDSYMANPAIYMLQTSVGAWDYSVVMKNSASAKKAAALVVANAMLEPDKQVEAFKTTGNGYNVAYEKLSSQQQDAFDDAFDEMGTLTPTSDEIANQSYVDMFGKVASWISSGWDQHVNQA